MNNIDYNLPLLDITKLKKTDSFSYYQTPNEYKYLLNVVNPNYFGSTVYLSQHDKELLLLESEVIEINKIIERETHNKQFKEKFNNILKD
jgi:hypothetical protein